MDSFIPPRDRLVDAASHDARARRVLLVGPRPELGTVAGALVAAGYVVSVAGGVLEALRVAQRQPIDIIVADLPLPDGDSTAMLRAFRAIANTARVPVIAIAEAEPHAVDRASRALLTDTIPRKGSTDADVVAAVVRCLASRTRSGDGAVRRWDTPAGGVTIVAPDGTRWSVHHVTGQDSRTKETLMFVSRAGYLRVANFPEDWRTLPTDKLFELSGHGRR